MTKFRIGLIINPLAGIGGAVGLKGSDGPAIVSEAFKRGALKQAHVRAAQALKPLKAYRDNIKFIAAPGEMGATLCQSLGFEVLATGYLQRADSTCPQDTENCAKSIVANSVDILLFVGGDGTARNIVNSVPEKQLCLGIPAGVKIHSGVFAINVRGASEMLENLIARKIISVDEREVRDIDEVAFREGIVRARYYGQLLTPQDHHNLQRVKCGGREVESLVLQDIADFLIDQMDEETIYVVGPGTTTRAVMQALDLDNTLLGVDLIQHKKLLKNDASERDILDLTLGKSTKILITLIGGQGHILGRGNPQISAKVINQVGHENLMVLSPKSKLQELNGRPLLVDTIDATLNQTLTGLIEVITGYEDRVVYQVSH